MKNRENNEKMALYNFIEEEPKKHKNSDDNDEANKDNEEENLEERKRKIKEKLKEGINKGKEDKDSGEPRELGGKFNLKGFVMLLFIVTIILSLPTMFSKSDTTNIQTVSYTDFIKDLKEDKLVRVDEREGYIYGYTSDKDAKALKARMITDRIGGDSQLITLIENKS
ncbi:MAG: ATP-dependent metallopeptidase FtsH/Yme1/Tma family protein, partial [Cetobacterium sp.]